MQKSSICFFIQKHLKLFHFFYPPHVLTACIHLFHFFNPPHVLTACIHLFHFFYPPHVLTACIHLFHFFYPPHVLTACIHLFHFFYPPHVLTACIHHQVRYWLMGKVYGDLSCTVYPKIQNFPILCCLHLESSSLFSSETRFYAKQIVLKENHFWWKIKSE